MIFTVVLSFVNIFNMKQVQKQQTVEMTFNFPDKLGQEIQAQPNSNEFVVKAAQKALLEEWQDEEVRKGLIEADNGEFASDQEVKAFFDKWIK